MTPQAFSYPTLASNGMIYVPPYGLNDSIDYMLKIDPKTYEVKKLQVYTSGKTERWMYGVEVNKWIYFFPYNESVILAVNTRTDSVEHIHLDWPAGTKDVKGKFISCHAYNNNIISLPYGEDVSFNHALVFDTNLRKGTFVEINCDVLDSKKWHTSQILDNTIYAVPRGETPKDCYFPYAVEFNCDTLEYVLVNMSGYWSDIDSEEFSNKKYTTLAKSNGKLYAPPYSENPKFDIMLKYDKEWSALHTGITGTSRKYFTHTTASNGKIYFPPAGHDNDWSDLLIIDSNTDNWYTKSLGIGKESKKYFIGCENSQGKIFWIPRGGCVCEPEIDWKKSGDLAEILVVDTKDDSYYTVDVSKYFVDNTTIEKYNASIIVNNIIFAFPYGQSKTFQNILVFDTILESVVKEINLNDL